MMVKAGKMKKKKKKRRQRFAEVERKEGSKRGERIKAPLNMAVIFLNYNDQCNFYILSRCFREWKKPQKQSTTNAERQ